MRDASWTPLPRKFSPTCCASEACSPIRTCGAKPCFCRCSASRRWIAIAAATACSGDSKLDEEAVAGRRDLAALVGGEDLAQRGVVPAQERVPGLVAERLDEVGRADDVGEHERLEHAPVRRGLAAQLPGQQVRDVLDDDRAGRAGERSLAQELVVDAVGVDDLGLAEVAAQPVEGRRRDGDAVARADALVPVDADPQRSPGADRGEALERERRRLGPVRHAQPSEQPRQLARPPPPRSAPTFAAISAFVWPSVRSRRSRRSTSSRPGASNPGAGASTASGRRVERARRARPAPARAGRGASGRGSPRRACPGRPARGEPEVAADELLRLRRSARQHGPRRRDDDLQVHVLVLRRLQRLDRRAARPPRRPGRRRAHSATVASAASACGAPPGCPGAARRSSLASTADRSASSSSSGVARARRRAARPRWPAGRAPRTAPTRGPGSSPARPPVSRCRRMPSASPAPRATMPRHSLELPGARRRRRR